MSGHDGPAVRGGPVPSRDDGTREFLRERPRLLGIAYRLLGSMWDAEDVVADAAALDPLDSLVKRETLSLATLRLMEQLTPPERAVFVLREAFDVPYAQIAEILDVSAANARQLLHRAQARLDDGHRRTEADESDHRELVERLVSAVGEGELDDLEKLLAADVVSYNDGGGRVRAAGLPVVGRGKIIRFITSLLRRFGPSPYGRLLEVNGEAAAQISLGGQDSVVAVQVRDGRIQSLLAVLNPDKLSYLYRQESERAGPAGVRAGASGEP